MSVCPSVPGCVALLRAPRSERSPRPGSSPRLEKELETLENSSSVASTKENLAEVAAVPAKEEKAEIVPNAQKVGTAKPCGAGWAGGEGARGCVWGGLCLVPRRWGWVHGAGRPLLLTSLFCLAESPGHSRR